MLKNLYAIVLVQSLLSTTSVRYYTVAQLVEDAGVMKEAYVQENDVLIDSLSNQVMFNVILNIETILNTATVWVNHVNSLRSKNIFQYGMTAPDRALLGSVVQELNTVMYIGLEDGTYFGANYKSVSYREPGNNGYPIVGIKPEDPNYKYYTACVDSSFGDPLNCTLIENDLFIGCINNCKPILCDTTKKQ
jgi:hypothetical protein